MAVDRKTRWYKFRPRQVSQLEHRACSNMSFIARDSLRIREKDVKPLEKQLKETPSTVFYEEFRRSTKSWLDLYSGIRKKPTKMPRRTTLNFFSK